MTKSIYRVLVLAGIAYLGLVLFLFMSQRSMQYHPDKSDPSPAQTKVPEMIEQEIMVPGQDIRESWYWLPPSADRTVVIFHGNASNIAGRDHKARVLIDAGYGVVLVGYTGYGGNRGHPTEAALYDDARAVVNDLINERGKPQESLVFYGESLGTGVAVKMASEYPKIAGLVLEVPFDSALALAQKTYPFVIGLSWLMLDQYRSDLLIGKLSVPKLVLAAGKDRVVPSRHARRLYALAPQPKKWLEYRKAAHGDLYDFGAGQDIVNFINTLSINLPLSPS